MFDCKQVIYADRTHVITEGTKLHFNTGGEQLAVGPICTALHFYPPEEEGKLRVVAFFEDGTVKYIYDIDEVNGMEAV